MPLDGEATFDLFFLIPDEIIAEPDLPVPASSLFQCCSDFAFKALADPDDADEFRNDKNGFDFFFNDVFTTVDLKLLKFNKTTKVYDEVVVLNDNTLGTFHAYGSFVNGFDEKFIGYQIEWRLVIAAHGEGSYKVQAIATSGIGGGVTLLSNEYCVKKFTPQRANRSVRLEYFLNRQIGDSRKDLKRRDYGDLNWYNSLRLPGYFGFPNSAYTKDYTRFNNGSRQWVQDEQEPEFLLQLKPVMAKIHNILRTDVMQADEVLITDYNSDNSEQWIKKSVQLTSDYPPEHFPLQNKLASVELTFRQSINNLKKRRQ